MGVRNAQRKVGNVNRDDAGDEEIYLVVSGSCGAGRAGNGQAVGRFDRIGQTVVPCNVIAVKRIDIDKVYGDGARQARHRQE